MIVVDTGSEDETAEIARRAGAKVVDFEWQDDFSAARNRGLQEARGDWVLSLDADEQLDPGTRKQVRAAARTAGVALWYLTLVNVYSTGAGGEVRLIRLFRKGPKTRYIGRIHEQVEHNLPEARAGYCGARILHYGYEPDVFASRRKKERNLRLLELGLRDTGDGRHPLLRSNYLHYWALSAASTAERLRRLEEFARFVFERSEAINQRAAWIPSGLIHYAEALRTAGRHEESEQAARKVAELCGEAPILHALIANARLAAGDLAAAEKGACRALDPAAPAGQRHQEYVLPKGAAQRLAKLTLAEVYEQQGRLAESEKTFAELAREMPAVRPWLAYVQLSQGKHAAALRTLEEGGAPRDQTPAHLACLAFVLSLLAESPKGLLWWGEKVRQAAKTSPVCGRVLRRVEGWNPGRPFSPQDFPELGELTRLLTVQMN